MFPHEAVPGLLGNRRDLVLVVQFERAPHPCFGSLGMLGHQSLASAITQNAVSPTVVCPMVADRAVI